MIKTVAIAFALTLVRGSGIGQASRPSAQPLPERGGQHDFDFNFGTWKSHIKRLQHPLTGSTEWIESHGTVVVSKVWNGKANLEEVEVDGPGGHLEGLTLRLYSPESRQWYLSWANGNDGTLGKAMVGEFKNGQGVFYDQETFNGSAILVRQIYSDINPNSYHFDQSFSDDGGKTWEPNWVSTVTRESEGQALPRRANDENRQHDFDFNFGRWKTHVSRLQHPLTGAATWVEYDGIAVVRQVWNGRANLLELEVDGPAGHIEGVGLRLYNPRSHQWSLNWANSADGTITKPMIGEFKNGGGEFFDQESFNGRAIFARNGFSAITPDSSRFEQAFSADGGKTWETNWVMTFTRTHR
jgi:BNR/Asp-box repeat